MYYSIDELINRKEDQTFDRKSARKDPKGLSNHFSAFANADGGTLVIGIEDNGAVTGIDDYTRNVNEILRVPFDYCRPSIRVETEVVECIDQNVGYTKSAQEYITQNKSYIVTKSGHDEMSGAAILLFGKDPQRFFQRARITVMSHSCCMRQYGTELKLPMARTVM